MSTSTMSLSTNDTTSSAPSFLLRQLQEEGSRSRAVLTVLYLCVLGLCFIVPVFYYFRMHCEERNARRMRELEMAGITEALEHSEQNREESRAARRKYREERRARIIQLFAPVRMILKEENFPHLREPKPAASKTETTEMAEQKREKNVPDLEEGGGGGRTENEEEEKIDDGSDKDPKDNETPTTIENLPSERRDARTTEEESTVVEVPRPGLYVTPNAMEDSSKLREVENMCTICLCNYEIGSDVVWSSNVACEHLFHTQCIEAWLMKQREGPLCPCCRRDFVIDPYDLEEEAEEIDVTLSLSEYQGNFTAPGNTTTTSPVSVTAFQVDTSNASSNEGGEEMEGSSTTTNSITADNIATDNTEA